jgi:hypothetical protein
MSVEIYFTRKARWRMKEMSAYEVMVNVLRDGQVGFLAHDLFLYVFLIILSCLFVCLFACLFV